MTSFGVTFCIFEVKAAILANETFQGDGQASVAAIVRPQATTYIFDGRVYKNLKSINITSVIILRISLTFLTS
jgi:hypothetical protein